jgi:hypothetical protein
MAKLANLPEFVFTEKIGIKQKPIAGKDEHPSEILLGKDGGVKRQNLTFLSKFKKELSIFPVLPLF